MLEYRFVPPRARPGGDGMAEVKEAKKVTYLGSGAFNISKPKRNRVKLRASRVKKPRRGSRK